MLVVTDFVRNYIENLEWTGKEGYDSFTGLFYSYDDGAGLDTIGVGHLNVEQFQALNKEAIYSLFERDLQQRIGALQGYLVSGVKELFNEKMTAALNVGFSFL